MSPLLSFDEKKESLSRCRSVESLPINTCIAHLELDPIANCIAHCILHHIAFSKGEVLVDDLVSECQDIPIFTYPFNEYLQIDLEEIQRQKEYREWELETREIDDYGRLGYLIQGGDPYCGQYTYGPEFVYQEDIPQESDRVCTDKIDVPGVTRVVQRDKSINIECSQDLANADIDIQNRSSSQACKVPVINMDEMLQDHGLTPGGNRRTMNGYYNNLSVMGYSKPFFFPPPDLGMVESLGSYENTSRFFRSVKSSGLNRSFGKNTSMIGVSIKSKNSTMLNNLEKEIPLRTQSTNDNIEIETFNPQKTQSEQTNSSLPNKRPIKDDISIDSLESIESNFSDPEKYRTSESQKDPNEEEPTMLHASISAQKFEKLSTGSNPNNLSMESYYVLEDLSKEGLQKYLKDSMMIFNEQYSITEAAIDEEVEVVEPSVDLCARYIKYVAISCKMEKEIPLIGLVYLERLLARTGILMNTMNWRRLILIAMLIASKLWDDDSLENEHFPKVMKDVTIREVNVFERVFLDLIGYDLGVQGQEYAR